jgi:hypothetical protein
MSLPSGRGGRRRREDETNAAPGTDGRGRTPLVGGGGQRDHGADRAAQAHEEHGSRSQYPPRTGLVGGPGPGHGDGGPGYTHPPGYGAGGYADAGDTGPGYGAPGYGTPGYGVSGNGGYGYEPGGYPDGGSGGPGSDPRPGYEGFGPGNPGYVGPAYTGPSHAGRSDGGAGYVGPGYVGPGYAGPGYAGPGYAGRVDDGVSYADPGFAGPGYAGRVDDGVTYADPSYAGPGYAGRVDDGVSYADPGFAGPGYAGRVDGGAGYAGPGYAGPGYDGASYANPGYAAPGYAAPGYAAPGYAAPGYEGAGYGGPGFGPPPYRDGGSGAPGYGGDGSPGYQAPGYDRRYDGRYARRDNRALGAGAPYGFVDPGPEHQRGPDYPRHRAGRRRHSRRGRGAGSWVPAAPVTLLAAVAFVVCVALVVAGVGLSHANKGAPVAAAVADNSNCTLIVPENPLTAQGLATPYRLTATKPAQGPCHEATADQTAFVQGAIINTTTGQISIYNPLVIDDGSTPAVAPVAPTLPLNSVVALWFGYNGNNLTLAAADQLEGPASPSQPMSANLAASVS